MCVTKNKITTMNLHICIKNPVTDWICRYMYIIIYDIYEDSDYEKLDY